jgi:hypothetical protein
MPRPTLAETEFQSDHKTVSNVLEGLGKKHGTVETPQLPQIPDLFAAEPSEDENDAPIYSRQNQAKTRTTASPTKRLQHWLESQPTGRSSDGTEATH